MKTRILAIIITTALFWTATMALWGGARLVSAAIASNSGSLQKDSNAQVMQVAPGFAMLDNTASAKAITNFALTSNVATVTAVAHGYIVGQQVVVAMLTGPALAVADANGTFVVASVPTTDTFTYALTHANIATGAATGTATAYFVSPMPAATGELTLVAPAKAIHLVVIPTTADMTWRKTSGGVTGGVLPLFSSQANHISAVEGDSIILYRANSTAFSFVYDTTR